MADTALTFAIQADADTRGLDDVESAFRSAGQAAERAMATVGQAAAGASGDLDDLSAQARTADQGLGDVAAEADDAAQSMGSFRGSIGSSEDALATAGRESGKFGAALDRVSGAGTMVADSMDMVSGTITAVTDIQQYAKNKAMELARAQNDVEQAMADTEQAALDLKQAQIDLNQSVVDSRQYALDAKQAEADKAQALIDARTAQEDYNSAVKEFGPDSIEAAQAAADLNQANLDLEQANIDASQATVDMTQAQADGEQAAIDMTQAQIDAKSSALDLKEAQQAAKPPTGWQEFGDKLALLSPLMMGIVGVTDLLILANMTSAGAWIKNTASMVASKVALVATSAATKAAAAAQWLLNVALSANPIGLIIIAIVALVAGFILLYQKCEWFRDGVNAVFGFIVTAAKLWWSVFSTFWSTVGGWLIALFTKWWEIFTTIWGAIFNGIAAYVGFIINTFRSIVSFVTSMPGKIAAAASGMWDGIKNSFRSAINWIIYKWNGISFRIPPISVPGIGQVWGGMTLSLPDLPYLAKGGKVVGAGMAVVGEKGPEILSMPKGAQVTPLGPGALGGGSQVMTLELEGERAIVELIRRLIRKNNLLQVV